MPVEGRWSALTVAGAVEAILSDMGSNPLLWGRRETPVWSSTARSCPDSGVILGCHPLFGQEREPIAVQALRACPVFRRGAHAAFLRAVRFISAMSSAILRTSRPKRVDSTILTLVTQVWNRGSAKSSRFDGSRTLRSNP